MKIYVSVNGEKKGPFTRLEVLDALQNGAFLKDDLCALEGEEEWKPLGEVYKPRPVSESPQKIKKDKSKKKSGKSIENSPKHHSWRDDPIELTPGF